MSLVNHLDKLKAFVLIAECGKLREAALRLHMSQPSLTRLIQTLEEASGSTLLYRSRQGVALTAAGELLFEYAASVIKQLSDLEERLKNPGMEHSGLLKIGSYESLAEYLWPEFIPGFKKTFPELKLSIHTSGNLNHLSALERGDLDVLVDAEPRILGDFISWVLYEDKFNFYKSAKKNSFVKNDEMPLIYCPAAFDRENKSVLRHLEEKGIFFNDKMELDSFTAVRTFCKSGMGIGVLPQRLARDAVEKGELSLINLPGFSAHGFGPHEICASIRANRVDDPRIKILMKALKNHFKK